MLAYFLFTLQSYSLSQSRCYDPPNPGLPNSCLAHTSNTPVMPVEDHLCSFNVCNVHSVCWNTLTVTLNHTSFHGQVNSANLIPVKVLTLMRVADMIMSG